MRKLLLGTSALIGATALVASATAAAPELTVSGKLNFQWTGGENPAFSSGTGSNDGGEDVGNARSGWQFDQIGSQSEINFFAEGESDGGTTYGANIDYRFLDSGSTDEAYIFISGDWGTVHLGQDDGAVNQTRFYAGSIAPGGYLIDGWTTSAGYSYGDTSDTQKILYVSNDLSGFKFALSVADAVGGNGELAKYEDIYEIGASYTADFGDGHIGVSLGYFAASERDEGNATQAPTAIPAAPAGVAFAEHEDLAEYVVGIKAGFGPVSFAASYADADDSGLEKGDASFGAEAPQQYTIGLAYDLGGGMAVGISYSEEESTAVTVAGAAIAAGDSSVETTSELTTIDFGFPIMAGMNGYAGIAFSDREVATTAGAAAAFSGATTTVSNEATTYVIGTKVSF